MNIGFKCNETKRSCQNTCNLNCDNEYITILIYLPSGNTEWSPKQKLTIGDFSNTDIVDAIISLDGKYLYLLSLLGTFPDTIPQIFLQSIDSIQATNTIYPQPFQGLYYSNNCTKIHEYIDNEFLLHCLSNKFYKSSFGIMNRRELFYLIVKNTDSFKMILYFDFFDQKFYKIVSLVTDRVINAISSKVFFEIGYYDNSNNYQHKTFHLRESLTLIQTITSLN